MNENNVWLDFAECRLFLVKGSINVISADSGVGKTWFSLVLALNYLKYNQISKVYHFNLDGSANIYKTRNLLDEVSAYKHLNKWISIDYECLLENKVDDPKQILQIFNEKSVDELSGGFMILDSLGNFTFDTNDGKTITAFYGILRTLANKGVTIIINTHNKKNEAIFSGNGAIKNYSDTLFSFKIEIDQNDENKWYITLEIQKRRHHETSQAFVMNLADKSLIATEYKEMANSQTREKIKNDILNALENEPNGLNKSQLLERIGKARDDKTANSVIKEFENKLWKIEQTIEQKGKPLIIKLIS